MNNDATRQRLFEQILNEYSGMVDRICYMYSNNSEDQHKDLYQECMLNIWQGLRNFRGDAKLSTWLYRACINTCVTSFRRHSKHSSTLPLDQASTLTADESSRPDDIKELYRLIGMLGDIDKAIIMMWLDENSYDEISEVTGMTRNTVASRIRRIKERLVKFSNS